jgi:nicotinamidase-related amidase
MTALWTEACLTFPSLDALCEGYEVYPVVDAVGGTSVASHEAALRRIEQTGGKPITWVQLLCELQRDWARKETVPAFMDSLSRPVALPASNSRTTATKLHHFFQPEEASYEESHREK